MHLGHFDALKLELELVVLVSGLVALILNLILPEEDADDDDDVVEVEDVEAQPHGKKEDH